MGHWLLPAASIGLATLLVSPSLWSGFEFDDYVHRGILSGAPVIRELFPSRLDLFAFIDGRLDRTHRMMDLGILPWWTSPGARFAFWRPLSGVTHWLDYALWPDRPTLVHAQSLVWFALLLAAVAVAYRQLLKAPWVAGLAAMLYALDNTHGSGVGWVAARNGILATFFGTLAILCHDRWRRSGWRAGAVLGPCSFLMGLLSAEAALATAAYLLAHALFLESGSWGQRARSLAPYVAVAAGWQALYTGLGYGFSGLAPSYINPIREPFEFTQALVDRAPVLLLAQWIGPPAQTYAGLSPGDAWLRWLGAVLFVGLLAVLLAPLLAENAVARFWGLGQLLAALATCSVFPNDRYLFFVGLGAMGLLAQWIGSLFSAPRGGSWSAYWRGLSIAAAAALLVVHLGVAPVRLLEAVTPPAGRGSLVDALLSGFPLDPQIGTQTIIVAHAPSPDALAFLPFIRAARGEPSPTHTRLLASGSAPLELFRPSARTLVVRPGGGYSPYFGKDQPLPLGYRVALTHTAFEVTRLTPDGRPAEATVHFDVDLDDPALRWLRWTEAGGRGRYVGTRPPAIGERITLE
jgi:hypothetical protein